MPDDLPIPAIQIDDQTSVGEVTAELERLGFFRGNDFSSYGQVTFIDIWYADFYNLFLVNCNGLVFWVTLEELKNTEVRNA